MPASEIVLVESTSAPAPTMSNPTKHHKQQSLRNFGVVTNTTMCDSLDEQKFFYACNIPFNVADNKVFWDTIKMLRPGYTPPSRKDIGGPLLDKVHDNLQALVKES